MAALVSGRRHDSGDPMKTLFLVVAWLLLLALIWPMVLDFILIAAVLWVLTLPLRLAWRARDYWR